jgi:hypothetical protein
VGTGSAAVSRHALRGKGSRCAMNRSARSFRSRFSHFVMGLWLLPLLLLSSPASAGMRWSARAIDPSLISAVKSDNQLLRETLFGEPPKGLTDKLKKDGHVDLGANKELMNELSAWAAERKAEVGDTEVELDKAWHGIHYLLTGSAEPSGTLASKVIMGGESIGPDQGYGPAQLLKPDEVKAIAQLLEQTTPDMLRERFKPKEMTRLGIYPDVIWERDGDEALQYVLDYYKLLAAFYKRAAERGQAVLFAIS